MYWKESDADISELPAVHEGEGVIRAHRFFGDRTRIPIGVAMWELDPGVSEGSHIHGDEGALEELYYFLKGDGVMWVEDEEVPVSAGDAVLVPDGIDHGFRNTGSEPLRLVLIWGKPVETEDERE